MTHRCHRAHLSVLQCVMRSTRLWRPSVDGVWLAVKATHFSLCSHRSNCLRKPAAVIIHPLLLFSSVTTPAAASTSAAALTTAPPQSHSSSPASSASLHVSSTLLSLLSRHSRGLPAHSRDIQILSSPSEFFSTLLELTARSSGNITLSSLYIGTGAQERQLVAALAARCRAEPALTVDVLLDYYRGTRPVGQQRESSVTALAPLLAVNAVSPSVSSSPPRVRAALFQPPPAPSHRWLDRLFRGRWRELIGVHHMKYYVFDQTVVVSGANLSASYFTDRMDRYVVIRDNAAVADWFRQLTGTLAASSFAHQVQDGGQLHRVGGRKGGEAAEEAGKQQLRDALLALVRPRAEDGQVGMNASYATFLPNVDSWIFPSLQLGMIGVREEETLLTRLLRLTSMQAFSPRTGSLRTGDSTAAAPPRPASPPSTASPAVLPSSSSSCPALPASPPLPSLPSLDIATGYMNLPQRYLDALQASLTPVRVLTASPSANGWHDATGIAYYVPQLYSALILAALSSPSAASVLRISEWQRSGFSFHAKGVWLTPPAHSQPLLTVVGSSNYGERSLERDAECSLVIVTRPTAAAAGLPDRLGQERDRLWKEATELSRDTFEAADSPRRLPCLLRWVAKFAKEYL